MSQDGFIIKFSHALHSVIGELKTHINYKLRWADMHLNNWKNAAANCAFGGWNWKNHCGLSLCYFYEVRGRYYCLFDWGFDPLHKVMEYEEQWCLELFLQELKRHREKLLDENNKTTTNHQYQTIKTFFISISRNATTQSRCHTSGVLLRILLRGYNRSGNNNA